MFTNNNKPVTIVRNSIASDKGYDVNVKNQVIVQYEDGKTDIVSKDSLNKTADSLNKTETDKTVVKTDTTEVPMDDRDPLTFLQQIGQKLKNPQTVRYPFTTQEVADEIDAYVSKLGSNRVVGHKSEFKDGKSRSYKA